MNEEISEHVSIKIIKSIYIYIYNRKGRIKGRDRRGSNYDSTKNWRGIQNESKIYIY